MFGQGLCYCNGLLSTAWKGLPFSQRIWLRQIMCYSPSVPVYRILRMNLQVTGGKGDDVPVFAWNDLMPGSNRNLFGTAKTISRVCIFKKGRWVRAKQGMFYLLVNVTGIWKEIKHYTVRNKVENVSFPRLPEEYSHMTWNAWYPGVVLVLVLQKSDRTQQSIRSPHLWHYFCNLGKELKNIFTSE